MNWVWGNEDASCGGGERETARAGDYGTGVRKRMRGRGLIFSKAWRLHSDQGWHWPWYWVTVRNTGAAGRQTSGARQRMVRSLVSLYRRIGGAEEDETMGGLKLVFDGLSEHGGGMRTGPGQDAGRPVGLSNEAARNTCPCSGVAQCA